MALAGKVRLFISDAIMDEMLEVLETKLVNGFEKAIGLSYIRRPRLYRARAVPFACQTRWVFKMNQLRAETE